MEVAILVIITSLSTFWLGWGMGERISDRKCEKQQVEQAK